MFFRWIDAERSSKADCRMRRQIPRSGEIFSEERSHYLYTAADGRESQARAFGGAADAQCKDTRVRIVLDHAASGHTARKSRIERGVVKRR
jgi:hypothetical protein